MSGDYESVLKEWALGKIPAHMNPVQVTSVSFDSYIPYGNDGCPTCGHGAADNEMTTYIYFVNSDGEQKYYGHEETLHSFECSLGEVLNELFAIADKREGR